VHLYGSNVVCSSEKVRIKRGELSSYTEDHNFEVIRVLFNFSTDFLENSMDGRLNRDDHDLLGDLRVGLLLVLRNTVEVDVVLLDGDAGNFSKLLGDSGGEQKGLAFRSQESDNTRNGRLETQLEHLIGLIQNESLDLPDHVGEALSVVEMVFKSSGSGDKEIKTVPDLLSILIFAGSSDKSSYVKAVEVQEVFSFLSNLNSQFSGGRNNEA